MQVCQYLKFYYFKYISFEGLCTGLVFQDIDESFQKCIFPFKFWDITFNSCTLFRENGPWCSTKVDINGDFIEGYYGYCGTNCPYE